MTPTKERITIVLDTELDDRIQRQASKLGISKAGLLRMSAIRFLENDTTTENC